MSEQLDLWEQKHPEKVVERKAQYVLLGRVSKDEVNDKEKDGIAKVLLGWGYSWATIKVALW